MSPITKPKILGIPKMCVNVGFSQSIATAVGSDQLLPRALARSAKSLSGTTMKLLVAGAIALALVSGAFATETITYTYDAKGRLVKVVHTGTVNNNLTTDYSHWNSPDLPDTEFRCDDDLGGFRWEGEHLLGSSSSRRLS